MFERQGFHFFTFRGIDVSVSLWYLLLMAFIAFGSLFQGGGGLMGASLVSGILFAAAITVSVLVHEFGHAFASKHYGLQPSVLLHGFGGLTFHRPASSDGRDALIIFAGPAIEILLGAAAWAFAVFGIPFLPPNAGVQALSMFTGYLMYVSIVWGLVNLLLPIWPLDGGQLFHLLLRRFMPEARAQDITLKISVFVLIPVGIVGFMMFHSYFIGLLALFLLMDNISALRGGRQLVGRKAKVRATDFQQELLDEAEVALEEGDMQEAYRLGHQLRSTGELPAKSLERIWEILAITSVEMGRIDEARSYLKRAPDSAPMYMLRQRLEADPDA